MKNRIKNATKKGFSLVELLVVVAIIGVLAGVGIVAYNGYIDSAKDSVNEANAGQLARKIITEKSKFIDFKAQTYPACAAAAVLTSGATTADIANAAACYAKAAGFANMQSTMTATPDTGNLSVGTDGKVYWKEIATGNAIKSK